MSNRLGPIEIICDAPPYPIVQACVMLEFERPLDVAWRHADRHAAPAEPEDNPDLPFWNWSGSHTRSRKACCDCGASLPALERYAFQYLSGKTAYFYLGQCSCCQTIFWREE
jgi:hypothetical protein